MENPQSVAVTTDIPLQHHEKRIGSHSRDCAPNKRFLATGHNYDDKGGDKRRGCRPYARVEHTWCQQVVSYKRGEGGRGNETECLADARR